MVEYIYTRNVVGGKYDIDNPNRVDEGGNQIYLAKEVESQFPTRKFTLHCDNSEAKFIFITALSEAQKTTLDTIVSNHQNNT